MTTMRHAPPNAAIMIEALRGLGYNTATALADIIDNSISAGARKVDLTFHWRESDCYIVVRDNGCVAIYRLEAASRWCSSSSKLHWQLIRKVPPGFTSRTMGKPLVI